MTTPTSTSQAKHGGTSRGGSTLGGPTLGGTSRGGARLAGAARGGSTLGALLALGVLGALGLGVWLARGAGEGAELDPDRVVVVERRDLIDAVNATGRVEPLARVAVMSRASGILEEILVDEGDRVTAGQVLAELDREQLTAQLQQDRADVAAAEARLAAAEARVAEARVRLDDPDLAFREREAKRLRALHESGDVPASVADEAERAAAAARFHVAQVEASLPVLAATVAEARANLDATRAALERNETALREATILCPIDGIVLVRAKEVGDGVSSILTAGGNATQILTLGDLSEMFVEARVDEVDLGRIRMGMPAIVTVDAHRDRPLEGRVERIAPAGSVDDNGIVTFEVRVTVLDPDGLLKPDMTAEAKLVVDRVPDALTLPQRAFRREAGGGWTVERVIVTGAGEHAERKPVELGLSDGLRTQVVSGLAAGERVLLPPTGPPSSR